MKKMIVLFVVSMICSFSFGLTWKTGETAGHYEGKQPYVYLPLGFKDLKNKPVPFITKIAKIPGDSKGLYEMQINASDVTFTYIVKVGDEIELLEFEGTWPLKKTFVVKSLDNNTITLELVSGK
ncbi:MAG: hypothetical protein J6P28_09335 [Treponema sp.]|nr:hypothetical protein [Treponema sp.]